MVFVGRVILGGGGGGGVGGVLHPKHNHEILNLTQCQRVIF